MWPFKKKIRVDIAKLISEQARLEKLGFKFLFRDIQQGQKLDLQLREDIRNTYSQRGWRGRFSVTTGDRTEYAEFYPHVKDSGEELRTNIIFEINADRPDYEIGPLDNALKSHEFIIDKIVNKYSDPDLSAILKGFCVSGCIIGLPGLDNYVKVKMTHIGNLEVLFLLQKYNENKYKRLSKLDKNDVITLINSIRKRDRILDRNYRSVYHSETHAISEFIYEDLFKKYMCSIRALVAILEALNDRQSFQKYEQIETRVNKVIYENGFTQIAYYKPQRWYYGKEQKSRSYSFGYFGSYSHGNSPLSGYIEEYQSIHICPFITGIKYGISLIITQNGYLFNDLPEINNCGDSSHSVQKAAGDVPRETRSDGVVFESAKIFGATENAALRPPAAPSPLSDSDQWRPGDTVLSNYRVEKELGRGSMGAVYLLSRLSTGEHFASKRALIRSETQRKLFLRGLKAWLELPEHPNLASCRFFRSVRNEIIIFTEYLEGGSLDRWILNGHGPLYEGEPDAVLSRIVNIAIQSAWGLHALHEWGLTHQDMKPTNVLLTADGRQVKVSDLGLARAMRAIRIPPASELGVVYAPHGRMMTKGFCSPEQKAGRLLSPKTDIWSWGLTVLQMFTGKAIWEWGTEAEEVLQSFFRLDGADLHIPHMPDEVANILGKCFQQDPAMRWGSLLETAEALRRVLAERVGESSLCLVPGFPQRSEGRDSILTRKIFTEVLWEDPRHLLRDVLEIADPDATRLETEFTSRSGSLETQAISDLAAYGVLVTTQSASLDVGLKSLEPALAHTYTNKALVHEFLSDLPEALKCYERAIQIYEGLVKHKREEQFSNYLADTYQRKGLVRCLMEMTGPAIPFFDQAIEIRERLVNEEGKRDLADDLAVDYHIKASALLSLGEFEPGISPCNQAIEIYEQLVNEGRWELEIYLADAYTSKAMMMACGQGKPRPALTFLDQGIAIYERLVNVEGERDLVKHLYDSYRNKAITLRSLGDFKAAIVLHDKAIAVFEGLVSVEGKWEVENEMAGAYQNKATTLCYLGEFQLARGLFDRAIEIRTRLLDGGQTDLRGDLAWVRAQKAAVLREVGERREASAEAKWALEVLEEEVGRTGRGDLQQALNWAKGALKGLW